MTTSARDFQFSPYLPRYLATWQSRPDASGHHTVDGTVLFADVSGFTRLSDELAKQGKIGSEQVTGILNGAFSELLDVALLDGGDLIHFGGDALFLMFHGEGHAPRAARSAFDMRQVLDAYQQTDSPVPLSMSMGLASGPILLFLGGATTRYLIATGATVDEMLALEAEAQPGQILMAPSTAALIPGAGDAIADHATADGGVLLASAPDADEPPPEPEPGPVRYSTFVPTPLHKHLTVSFYEGEHRVANVAFVKLAGVAAVLEGGGMENAAGAVDVAVTAVEDIADRYGVSVLASDVSVDGAKLMLATGVPERLDAEEERILRAASEIVVIDTPLQVSAGVARGRVFACDLGSRMRRVYTTIGATSNLAARLAAAAAPGKALVTGLILDRSASIFDATKLPAMTLKGKEATVAPYELGTVIGGGATRVSTRHPLVGRDTELAALLDGAAVAAAGGGNVVDLVGEPGIGKTRLVQELVDVTGAATVTALAEPYEMSTAYYVAGQVVRHALGLAGDAEPDELGTALQKVVAERAPRLLPWLPLIARVAGATVAPTPESEALDDEFQVTKTCEVVAELMAATMDHGSVVVVDAAEWTDAASRAVLQRLMSDSQVRPRVVFLSKRPGSDWGPTDRKRIVLEGLWPEAARRLVDYAAGDSPLPPWTRDAIVERAGGVPSFLLALVAGARDGDEDLPESIEAAGEARIDRLSPRDRRLLRFAAVLGRQFTLDLLVEVLPELATDLDDLSVWDRLGEFLETTAAGRVRFRQPIIRDVAYAGLPFARRAALHRRVGEALEHKGRHRPERFAELLSLHFGEAGEHAKAWHYALIAAERARGAYAHVVAAALYRRALRAGAALGAQIPAAELARVAEALGDVTDSAGFLHESEKAYEHALADRAGDRLTEGRLLRKAAMIREKLGFYEDALSSNRLALQRLADAEPDLAATRERFEAMLAYAGVLNRKGEAEESVAWCRRVLAEADEADHAAAIAHACNLLESNYTKINHPDRGLHYPRALSIYRHLGDLAGEAKVLNNLGNDAYFRGEWADARTSWEESASASSRAGDVVTSATIMNNLAELDIDRGELDSARDRLIHALEVFRGAGYNLGIAYAEANLGRVAGRTGQPEASAHLDEAERLFGEVGSRHGLLDVQRRRAETLLAGGRVAEARPILDQAAESAEDVPGTAVLRAAIHRLRGFVFAQSGDAAAARRAWHRSLELARASEARYEEALTLDALSRHAVHTDTADEWGAPAAAILASLGAHAPPPLGVAAVTAAGTDRARQRRSR